MPLTTQTRTFASWTTTKGRVAAPWNPGPGFGPASTKGRLRFSLWNSTSPEREERGQIKDRRRGEEESARKRAFAPI